MGLGGFGGSVGLGWVGLGGGFGVGGLCLFIMEKEQKKSESVCLSGRKSSSRGEFTQSAPADDDLLCPVVTKRR